jgi:hypothetical protein
LRYLLALIAVVALASVACGGTALDGADSVPDGAVDDQPIDTTFGGDPNAGGGGGSQPGEVEPEPAGAVEPNTIRIGSQVWKRTLPMTEGQCFLQEDDGTLPTSANVWGPVDGNEGDRFSARHQQDGTFEADVTGGGDSSLFWLGGTKNPEVNDLVIELDFDAQTIKGHGTFWSLTEQRAASGSFHFICEPGAQ